MSASGKSKCPTCEKESDKVYYPFCSERCQLVDLWNWFNGEYGFSEPLPQNTEDPEEPEPFWRN